MVLNHCQSLDLMRKKTLDVSVVIPCYNSHNTLVRSLVSVVNQVCLPREIIIIDDGSDDPIEPLINEFSEKINIPIKILTQLNFGASAARNAGIRLACSRYIAFLDADDIWLPEKLMIQYAVMEAKGLSICGHRYAFDANKISIAAKNIDSLNMNCKRIFKLHFAYGNPLYTPTVMVLKDKFLGFDERFRRVDDYKAWLDSFESGKCACIEIVLAAGFKPPIGHSGLTGSIDRMHESYLDVLKALLHENKIGIVFYVLARAFEAVKLPIRRYRVKNTSYVL
jgi:glycosyltransferase involved in cell wall biosynthesis